MTPFLSSNSGGFHSKTTDTDVTAAALKFVGEPEGAVDQEKEVLSNRVKLLM